MIKEIKKEELLSSFKKELIEVEFGHHFDERKQKHQDTLLKKINEYYNTGSTFYGLYEKELPIGFITIKINENLSFENNCEILEIGVKRDKRDKGYGTELLTHIENECKKNKCYCIFVKTYAANYKAIHFYGKNNYVPISVISGTNGPNDEGTIVMRKNIIK